MTSVVPLDAPHYKDKTLSLALVPETHPKVDKNDQQTLRDLAHFLQPPQGEHHVEVGT